MSTDVDESSFRVSIIKAIHSLDKLIALSEEKLRLLRTLRVALLKKLYPNLNWQRDQNYSAIPVWHRVVANEAAHRFKREQATVTQQKP